MTTPDSDELPDLLDPVGLQKFATADQTFFLQAAGQLIRDFCGWHVAPSVAVVDERAELGHDGIITLPSMHVTSIDALSVGEHALTSPEDYTWDATGTIELHRRHAWPRWRHRAATVSYTHGFGCLPPNVAAIGYELTLQALSRPGANAKDIGAGPYRVTLLKLGVSLDADQRARLYEAGIVRPQFA